jgi:hypothetical protein
MQRAGALGKAGARLPPSKPCPACIDTSVSTGTICRNSPPGSRCNRTAPVVAEAGTTASKLLPSTARLVGVTTVVA